MQVTIELANCMEKLLLEAFNHVFTQLKISEIGETTKRKPDLTFSNSIERLNKQNDKNYVLIHVSITITASTCGISATVSLHTQILDEI